MAFLIIIIRECRMSHDAVQWIE